MNKEIYIAKSGSNLNDGSKDAPLLTLEAAFKKMRGCSGRIILCEGEYCGCAELSDACDVVIEPNGEDKVSITGAAEVKYSDFKPVSDPVLRSKISPKVLELDLSAFGIKPDPLAVRGFRRPYTAANNELVADGKTAVLSAYPKEGFIKIEEIEDTGSISMDVPEPDFSNRGGIFKYTDERISALEYTENLMAFGYFSFNFGDDTLKIKKIDKEKKTIELGSAVMFGLRTRAAGYRLLNVIEEMTEPGEYCLDSNAARLYYIPHEGLSQSSKMYITVESEPLISIMNCKNVVLKNITVCNSRGIGLYMEGGENNVIDGCTFSGLGIMGICIGKGVEPDTGYHHHHYKGKPISKALGSWHEHIYNDVLFDREAGKNHTVRNCKIFDCGAGGISMGGGNRKTLEAANNTIEHCVIHDCNRLDKAYKGLINIDGVGNTITDCELYNATNMAVYAHGNRHVLQYCDIHDCCTEADDAGAFYIGRDPSERENTVRFNYFHDIHVPHKPRIPIKDGLGTFAVYNDDSACHVIIHSNIFHRAGTWAIHNNCCKDISITNNIFSECQAAVAHGDGIWANPSYIDENSVIYDRLINQVKISEPPYSDTYPELLTYFEEKGKPVRNLFASNIIYKCLNGLALSLDCGWYINDELMPGVSGDFIQIIHDYEGWYEEYGNYTINKTIDTTPGWSVFFDKKITSKTVGFKPFDLERILSPKISD